MAELYIIALNKRSTQAKQGKGFVRKGCHTRTEAGVQGRRFETMKNLPEGPGECKPGHFPFLRSQESLSGARELQERLRRGGIHSEIIQEREFARSRGRMPSGTTFDLRVGYVEGCAELDAFLEYCSKSKLRNSPSNNRQKWNLIEQTPRVVRGALRIHCLAA